jgi:hypothetical protein
LYYLDSDSASGTSFCNNPQQPFLLVGSNHQQEAATTLGYRQIQEGENPLTDGSTMTVDPAATYGTFDAVANIAHEIGHAFGMLHEHQRPFAWSSQTFMNGGTANNGAQLLEFQCTNLKDYATFAAKNDLFRMDTLCAFEPSASAENFSASQILPFSGFIAGSRVAADSGDFDWDSIMLYPSQSGGVILPNAPNPQQPNDMRAIVMTKYGETAPNNVWGPNTAPSQMDVLALSSL